MSVVLILLPISLLLAIFFALGFFWSVKNGQYDELDSPSMSIFLEAKKINKFNHKMRTTDDE